MLALAMPMQKIISEKLKHAGGKTFWEVKPSETEDIGGVRYLRLPCQGVQHGFARLCLEEAGVMRAVEKKWSLTTSKGYHQLVQARNAAQVKHLTEELELETPDLFKGVVSHVEVGKKKCSRQKLKELREHPGVLTITVPETPLRPAFDTTVKRPVNERDDLVVPFDAEVVEGIVAFIQSSGWEECLKRPAELPRGVVRRKRCRCPYQYVYKQGGKTSRHFASSLQGAIIGKESGPPQAEDEGSTDEEEQEQVALAAAGC